MLQIDDKIISFEVFRKRFACDVAKCKGACCVHGDSGAPLEDGEIDELRADIDAIKAYMSDKGIDAITQNDICYQDEEGDWVTTLIDNKECAFTVFDSNGVAKCSIEQAFFDGKTKFRKPISCHLYPIRIGKLKENESLRYDEWSICKDAVIRGEKENIRLHEFLQEPLERKYGAEWYKEFKQAAEEFIRVYLT